MFIGHYALAFSAKKVDNLPSLAMMFIAVQLLDLLWPIFVLLGFESFEVDPGNTVMTPLNFTFYPYSHSLLTSMLWGAILGVGYYSTTKNRKGSILLGGLVVSHWLLDWLTHGPDLPLSPFGDMKVGLGLWNVPAATIIIEVGLFVAGVFMYYKVASPRRKVAFWSLIAFFLIIYVMNLMGPPPPSPMAVAWTANAMWIFVLWAWWVERE